MEISVRQTPIKPKYIKKLLLSGILLVSHLNTFDRVRLAEKTNLNLDECDKILAVVKPKRPHHVIQLSDLLAKPFERISTTIEGLDEILNGGIQCGHLTEISGQAGVGKSNLCTQMSISAMLSPDQKGLNADVLLIFTEGTGKLQLAIKRFTTLAESINKEELVIRKLHVKECFNEFELEEIINRLPELLDLMPSVKLVVIDSITCAFIVADETPDFEFYSRRSLRLTRIAKVLAQVAWDRRVAVAATNHVSYSPKEQQTKPALGRIWSHLCHTKIYLDRAGPVRLAHVTKGAMFSPEPVRFLISNKQPD